ncbi:MAG: hypothetical protein QOF61_1574 [Acidobacteriota bacterium]|nr:hypothetical protein [Acidobacteriota bacterium]
MRRREATVLPAQAMDEPCRLRDAREDAAGRASSSRRHSPSLDKQNFICRIFSLPSGSNSVVECDLAKVEVAGSNPVSRSKVLG